MLPVSAVRTDGCEIDRRLHGIGGRPPRAQAVRSVERGLQLAGRSLADSNQGDGAGEVSHEVGQVRGFRPRRTSADNRRRLGRAGVVPTSGIDAGGGAERCGVMFATLRASMLLEVPGGG